MGMNPRPPMEMQQRIMMRHMQMRGNSAMSQQQQMSMMRSAGPGVDYNPEMMPLNNQGMINQNPAQNSMMGRFSSNPVGRPPLNNNPQVPGSNGGGHRLNHQQQNPMYPQQMQQQHSMIPGGVGPMPRNPMMQPNTMNMPARRMSSMHPNNNMVPLSGGGNAVGNPSRDNMAFMSSQQQQVQMSMNNVPSGMSPHEWMSMQQQQQQQHDQQQGMNRNFNMQQQQQSMRAGQGNPNFRSSGPGIIALYRFCSLMFSSANLTYALFLRGTNVTAANDGPNGNEW